MERLTYRLTDQCDHPTDSIILKPYLRYEEPETRKKILNRLAAYEDTGLEPEEIYEVRFLIAAQRDPQKLARLRELVLADQNGRLVVLPCKVGDTVYGHNKTEVSEYKVSVISLATYNWYLRCQNKNSDFWVTDADIGRTVFLTREEAELAVKGGESDA